MKKSRDVDTHHGMKAVGGPRARQIGVMVVAAASSSSELRAQTMESTLLVTAHSVTRRS